MHRIIQSQMRIPTELFTWLKASAAKQHRSMNGQLLAILEEKRLLETAEMETPQVVRHKGRE